ncbi:hypothetical protein [Paenibacillus sp. YN15]|uniref:hypothetical protein n=1 Tax=Paenibacillus sp. YN15 TaxID=1742774 RepID=UPI000DCB8837|nr:hypothetical protein [Paenibacillus sp. YN15]RAU93316.1 hypothetical protein DQG13_25990 [Paenibacillus sp. YN15]
MKDTFMKANTAQVNKIIAGLLWVIFALSTLLLVNGHVRPEAYGSLFMELALATFLILRGKKPVLAMSILLMAILTCTVPYIETSRVGMTIMIVLCVVSLYVNKALLYSFGAMYNIAFIVIYYSGHGRFDTDFFVTLGFIELTIVALYFVCKRNADLIRSSIEKEARTKELLDSLDNMVSVIQANTASLSGDITVCNQDIGTLKAISAAMAGSVQEVTEGEALTRQVLEHFHSIRQAFAHIDGCIADESAMTGQIGGIFSQIRGKVQHISDISHMHAAATEEMLTTTREQGASIEVIYDAISNIHASGLRLQGLTEKGKRETAD